MIDVYEMMKSTINVDSVEINNMLFVKYQCIETGSPKVLSRYNYFVYLLSGNKKWESINNTYSVSSGDMLFVKKGVNIVHHTPDEEMCILFVFLPDEVVIDFINNHREDLPINLHSKANPSDMIIPFGKDVILQGYFNSLISYLNTHSLSNEKIMKHKLDELLLYIFSEKKYYNLQEYFYSITQNRELRMKQIMLNNYKYNLKIENYAELCNMSVSTFKRKFKTIFKKSPGKWLVENRLSLSTKHLLNTNNSIDEISDSCGFNDVSYFIQLFKKKYNTTPHQFRNTKI